MSYRYSHLKRCVSATSVGLARPVLFVVMREIETLRLTGLKYTEHHSLSTLVLISDNPR